MTLTDERVDELLALITVPGRSEPRRAEQLRNVDTCWVETPHGTVAAWRLGEGPATLLVHGWKDDHCVWTRLMTALSEREMSVVVFDLPGHGNSGGTAGYSFEVADAILRVASEVGPIASVVAHSFASGCAVVALAEGLDVGSAVFVSSPFGRGNRWEWVAFEHGFTRDEAHAAQAKYEARFSAARAHFDWWTEVPRLDTDVLFVHSTADARAPIDGVREVVALSPRAALAEFDGLDHRGTARDGAVIERILAHLTKEQLCSTNFAARP